MPNFNSIGSEVSEPQVAENCLTIGRYVLTCYTVIIVVCHPEPKTYLSRMSRFFL